MFAGFTFGSAILIIVIYFIARKPIKALCEVSSEFIEYEVSASIRASGEAMSRTIVTNALENKVECQDRLTELGITENIDDIVNTYRKPRKRNKQPNNP